MFSLFNVLICLITTCIQVPLRCFHTESGLEKQREFMVVYPIIFLNLKDMLY